MNKYHLVSDKRVEEATQDNEIRITKDGVLKKYISYAFRLIQDEKKSLVIKAMGQTINKGITLAEILKRRIAGLHQITQLGSVQVNDVYEPIEEGLDTVELTRFIPSVVITLSFEQLDVNHHGYQPPIPADVFAQISAERVVRGVRRGNNQEEYSRRTSPRSEMQKPNQTDERNEDNRTSGRNRDARGRGRGNQSGGRGRGQGAAKRRGSRRNSARNNTNNNINSNNTNQSQNPTQTKNQSN